MSQFCLPGFTGSHYSRAGKTAHAEINLRREYSLKSVSILTLTEVFQDAFKLLGQIDSLFHKLTFLSLVRRICLCLKIANNEGKDIICFGLNFNTENGGCRTQVEHTELVIDLIQSTFCSGTQGGHLGFIRS